MGSASHLHASDSRAAHGSRVPAGHVQKVLQHKTRRGNMTKTQEVSRSL